MHSEKRPKIHGCKRMALVAFIDQNYSHVKCPSNGKSIEVTNSKYKVVFATKGEQGFGVNMKSHDPGGGIVGLLSSPLCPSTPQNKLHSAGKKFWILDCQKF